MGDDQFTKLFRYMQEMRQELHGDIEAFRTETQEKFDRIYGILDAMAKRQEAYEQEQLIIGHQLTRHENWITAAAQNKVNPGYNPSA